MLKVKLENVIANSALSPTDYRCEDAPDHCASCHYSQVYGGVDSYYHLCESCKDYLAYIFKTFLRLFNRAELEYLDSLVEGTTLMDIAGRPADKEAAK